MKQNHNKSSSRRLELSDDVSAHKLPTHFMLLGFYVLNTPSQVMKRDRSHVLVYPNLVSLTCFSAKEFPHMWKFD